VFADSPKNGEQQAGSCLLEVSTSPHLGEKKELLPHQIGMPAKTLPKLNTAIKGSQGVGIVDRKSSRQMFPKETPGDEHMLSGTPDEIDERNAWGRLEYEYGRVGQQPWAQEQEAFLAVQLPSAPNRYRRHLSLPKQDEVFQASNGNMDNILAVHSMQAKEALAHIPHGNNESGVCTDGVRRVSRIESSTGVVRKSLGLLYAALLNKEGTMRAFGEWTCE
jgi:hypothetical protein